MNSSVYTAIFVAVMVTSFVVGVVQEIYTDPWTGTVRDTVVYVTFNGTSDPAPTSAEFVYRTLPWRPEQKDLVVYNEDENWLRHELHVEGITPSGIANGLLPWIVAAGAWIALTYETRRHV